MTPAPQLTPALLLVEPLAAGRGGHWTQSLPLLAAAARRAGRPVVVAAVNGIDPAVRASAEGAGARILVRPQRAISLASLLLICAHALEACYTILEPRFPRRALPHQLRLFSRCLAEAASLRAGRAALRPQPAITAVVLTSNITLHATVSALAGTPHVRFLHELSRDESRSIRALEWLLAASLRSACFFCTTAAVRQALRKRYPAVDSIVKTYALLDPSARLDAAQRQRARESLGLSAARTPVASLVGSWWNVKDISTVLQALPHVDRRFTLLVAGDRLDGTVLSELDKAHLGELHVIDRPLTSAELALVYGASDFTIVSRAPSGKESGVALDAVSRGIPIVISDHDELLARKLDGEPWARVFRRGDPESLARALDDAILRPLARPPRHAAVQLGMCQADQMLSAFDRAAARLT